MKTETIILNAERNVTLTAYLQDCGNEFRNIDSRPGILVLPGGGYQYCSEREADPVTLPYLAAGFQAFILRYSVKKDAEWPQPLDDYEQAMELIRSKASEWGVLPDKMAVIGFSAGGHLAAAAATMSKNRPNAAILGYAVASEQVKYCNKSAPDTIAAVDANTCPCFLFHTRDDAVVPISNTIGFIDALDKQGRPFECHIYSSGPHGFSLGTAAVNVKGLCSRGPAWVQDSIDWLKETLGGFPLK